MPDKGECVVMNDLLTKLRQHRPAIVIAYDQDDEATTIHVPDVRKKWERVMGALDDLHWMRIDMQNKKGGHLHRHMRTVDDTSAQELDTLASNSQATIAPQLAPLVTIMLRAQEVAVSRHQQGTQQLLDAVHKMLESFSRRLDLQERQYEHAMAMNHQLTTELIEQQLQQAAEGEAQQQQQTQRPHSDSVMAALMPRLLTAALTPQQQQQEPRVKNGANGQPKERRSPSRPDAGDAAAE